MNKKYSVFVSSTYEDLKEERQEVVNALLQMDCFPVGMEYFNASDQSQWDVIKSLIDECDYYVLIILFQTIHQTMSINLLLKKLLLTYISIYLLLI